MPMAGKFDLGNLPRLNDLIGSALVRAHLTDFHVKKIFGFKPTGVGEHFLLEIRKRNQNTNGIAKISADLAGIGISDIGYCGLKDRIAETTQCVWPLLAETTNWKRSIETSCV